MSETRIPITFRVDGRLFDESVNDARLRTMFPTAETGDEVLEHHNYCIRDMDDDGYCSCDFQVWRLTEDGWRRTPDPDGRVYEQGPWDAWGSEDPWHE